jgi:4-hydroxy-3-methylbut-2-enyl diphosphate reductase
VLRINEAAELPDDLAGTVAVTAGASAPDAVVDAVVARLAPTEGVEEVRVTDEDEYFPPPPELRDLLGALAGALSLGLAAPAPGSAPGPHDYHRRGQHDPGDPLGTPARDRHVSAADVLARLAG